MSQVFAGLWRSCLHEHLRELSYQADLAGLGYSISNGMDDFQIGFQGYNDGISNFINEVLKSLQTYKVSEDFFNIKRELLIR